MGTMCAPTPEASDFSFLVPDNDTLAMIRLGSHCNLSIVEGIISYKKDPQLSIGDKHCSA